MTFREELAAAWDILDKAAKGEVDTLLVGHEGCTRECEAKVPHLMILKEVE